ncbi:MAG: hypothetical protein ABI266_07280, partial [Ginsengibacter sp.]
MNFRNILLAALLVLFGQKSHAQKTVYAILIEDNFGLTDSLGTEIIAPKYDRISDSKDKKLQVFHPYYSSSENVLLYNVQTGEINKKFKYIYLDNVLIGQQYYHYFDDNKKSYLQNSQTNEIIKTKEKIYSIENLGSQYLAAKFFPTDNDFPKPAPRKPKPVAQAPAKKDPKTGKLIPPPPIIQVPLPPVRESGGSLNGYVFYSNTLPLKTLLKIEAQMYMPLYETNEIDNNYIKNIREFNSPDFDYLVFRKNKQLFLYDKDFKLLNKITYPKKEESDDIDKEFV